MTDFANMTVQELSSIRDYIRNQAEKLGADPQATADIIIAANEAIANIVRHGYNGRPGPLALDIIRENGDLVIKIEDKAPPFNPLTVKQPDTSLPLGRRPIGGLGVYLMRQYSDQIDYQLTAGGENKLTLRKNKAFSQS